MTTEAQVKQLYDRVRDLELRRNECCLPLVFWEARVQIVRLNTNVINAAGFPQAGGFVVSSFDENLNVDTARRGLAHKVIFPVKWDDDLYFPITPEVNVINNSTTCSPLTNGNNSDTTPAIAKRLTTVVQYRYMKDASIRVNTCNTTQNTRSGFFIGVSNQSSNGPLTPRATASVASGAGMMVRVDDAWGPFIRDIEDDGTVTITNDSFDEDYNVIRYYTQWTLNRCADGSLLSDNTFPDNAQPRV